VSRKHQKFMAMGRGTRGMRAAQSGGKGKSLEDVGSRAEGLEAAHDSADDASGGPFKAGGSKHGPWGRK
jgi:hypothetical protein